MSAARDWLVIGGLALGPAVTNGFARFAYGQILPAMRDDLGWSYAEAGWLNTANAIGYLLGALLALALIGRVGARRLFIFGMALTTASLIASALTRDLWALSAWRIAAGVGGAPVFIAGGRDGLNIVRERQGEKCSGHRGLFRRRGAGHGCDGGAGSVLS